MSTAASEQKRLQPREPKAILLAAPDLLAIRRGREQPRARPIAVRQFIFDRGNRVALEVPPSDAKLPPNCQLVDVFVDASPILTGVNADASFCGMMPREH